MKNIFLNFGKSILSKLLSSYLLLIIIPICVIGFMSFKVSERIIESQVTNSNRNMLMQIEKNVTMLVDQVIALVNIYYFNPQLEPILNKQYSNQIEKLIDADAIMNIMSSYSFAYDWLKQQSILIGNNNVVYSNTLESIDAKNWEAISESDWYNQLQKKPNKLLWLSNYTGPIKEDGSPNMFAAIKTLQNNITNNSYGILILTIEEATLYNIYKDALNSGNEIFIMDSKGNIVSHYIRELVGKKADTGIYSNLLSMNDNSKVIELNNKKYLCISKKIDKIDWYLIQTIPLSEILKDADFLRTQIIITSLLCLVVSFFIAIVISRKISLPLINLSNRVKLNKYHENSGIERFRLTDEISMLSTEYDNIILKLENTINNLVKEQEDKRKAELHALQMQINPHFLYNTLNSIKCLVWTKKILLIEPMIDALVNLLEQTINCGDELITIEEEIDNVKNYMFIQGIRTGNSIITHYKIDESLKKYKIPKLLLQPIVENSIFHGIEPKQKGSISILCSSNNNRIKIEIIDDGVGIDNNTIIRILSKEDNEMRSRFTSIGIRNVNERLTLYFGPQYGLKINSELGVGTVVTVTLPIS